MIPSVSRHMVINLDASDLAFKIGQIVERSVMDRAMELVAREGGREDPLVIRRDHVRAAAQSLPANLQQLIGDVDGEEEDSQSLSA